MTQPTRREFLKLSAFGMTSAAFSLHGWQNWPAWMQAVTRAARLQTGVDTLNHPDFLGSEMLTRPTDQSVTVNIIPAQPMEAYFEYGTASGAYSAQTPPISAAGGEPILAVMENLLPNTRYYYRVRFRSDAGDFAAGLERTFVTRRSRGEAFVFGVQADSHLGTPKHNDPALYQRTLNSAAQDNPDFYIDLGDTFRASKLKEVTPQAITRLYLNQRPFLGSVAHSAPLFLVNGNHEMEWGWLLDGTANSVPALCVQARKRFYPQPEPDGFYTGDAEPKPECGLAQDYYAWEWGDALFVVIDPYWNTLTDPGGAGKDNVSGQDDNRDPWRWTLGEAQYRWLAQTLEQSAAPYKFVFHHHVLGACRGGVEWADYYEWGGKEHNGADTFAQNRPGWELPVHQLMVEQGVTVFFQGHDHIFARQERDGVVYQTVPMCADPGYNAYNRDAFTSGDTLPNTGHLRVTVAPEGVTVEYIRSYLDQPDEMAYAYTVAAAGAAAPAAAAPGVILGRPTSSAITLSLLSAAGQQVSVAYGAGGAVAQTAPIVLQAGEPQEVRLTDLLPDTAYSYRFLSDAGESDEHTFHTQRASGSAFTFTLDADPHNRDPQFSGDLYAVTLANVLRDRPDFHINLGDTFMTEKLKPQSYAEAQSTFTDLRPYFERSGADVPLYLVNGNHEGELGWMLVRGNDREVPIWSTQLRQLYYPNPQPDGFYSGATSTDPDLGAVRDSYFSWTWGDALFVVLDPFWYTRDKPRPDDANGGWNWTLGPEQYDWLRATLESSTATFRFICIHHLVGGSKDARGGVEVAGLFEWGGNNADGSAGFEAQRPGWGKPIHQLLVEGRVNAVFHGHDHVYVRQELDGIVYQELPQPSHPLYDNTQIAADYGYLSGVIFGSSGHLRVSVTPAQAVVEYVRAYLPKDENAQRVNGQVSDSYTLLPR
jgi:phosphodiesterase/alkaline phosphatase D-like protein